MYETFAAGAGETGDTLDLASCAGALIMPVSTASTHWVWRLSCGCEGCNLLNSDELFMITGTYDGERERLTHESPRSVSQQAYRSRGRIWKFIHYSTTSKWARPQRPTL